MSKFVSALFIFLVSSLSHAADVAEIPPTADVSVWPMIIVALVFAGMIGGFLLFIWVKERKSKER